MRQAVGSHCLIAFVVTGLTTVMWWYGVDNGGVGDIRGISVNIYSKTVYRGMASAGETSSPHEKGTAEEGSLLGEEGEEESRFKERFFSPPTSEHPPFCAIFDLSICNKSSYRFACHAGLLLHAHLIKKSVIQT